MHHVHLDEKYEVGTPFCDMDEGNQFIVCTLYFLHKCIFKLVP